MIKSTSNNVRIRGKIRREEWPKIAERFRNGETLSEIARSYQCTAPAIRYILSRVSARSEEGNLEDNKSEGVAAPARGDGRRATMQVVSVDAQGQISRGSAGSPPAEIWDRISSDIASFLAGMDALTIDDSDENYEALLVAADRLLRASALTRLELERILNNRRLGNRKIRSFR
jgi:hypothetical protein